MNVRFWIVIESVVEDMLVIIYLHLSFEPLAISRGIDELLGGRQEQLQNK